MTIFDGYQFAQEKEQQLALRVSELKKQRKHPSIAAILFREDAGSQLYTRLKRETAERVGIKYQVFDFSLTDPVEKVTAKIQELNNDDTVTGIIIQKPWRKTYISSLQSAKSHHQEQPTQNQENYTVNNPLTTYHLPLITYNDWWHSLTSALEEKKDVDGLHPNTIEAIKKGTWEQEHRVLPATCKAVLTILEKALTNNLQLTTYNLQLVSIIGKSDLLGTPLFYELKRLGWKNVELLGKKELQAKIDSGEGLKNSRIIITATGQQNLITKELISENTIIIDAGEPKGDVDFERVKEKVDFITPVPGGVGPVTIVSLLENCVELTKTTLP